MKNTPEFRLFLVGASAGGYKAIIKLLEEVPADINAAFFIVVHGSFDQTNFFGDYLRKRISLNVDGVPDKSNIRSGTVFLSKPDSHLYIHENVVSNIKGPRENLFRPSIDVLFRSGGVAFGNRCVGVLLTGRLYDGVSGLAAIKQCGGLAVIQNPATAEFSEMPENALDLVEVDFIFDLEKLAKGITDICKQPLPPERSVPDHIRRESLISATIKSQIKVDNSLGEQVPFSCASCGGPLWKMHDEYGTKRYRCHVGHSFTPDALLESQNQKLEETLWASLRTMEEKKQLLTKMAEEYTGKNFKSMVQHYQDKIKEIEKHISHLRYLMKIHD